MMANTRKILFEQITPITIFMSPWSLPILAARKRHCTHDFWEMMYVLEGSGSQWVDQRPQALSSRALLSPTPASEPLFAGDLLWIRPWDVHSVCARDGRLHFINVAFSAQSWQGFRTTAELKTAAAAWDHAERIPKIAVPAGQQADCAAYFECILRAFHTRASRLDLCRFWAEVLPLLLPEGGTGKYDVL